MAKTGRPIRWPEPKNGLAQRLQRCLPKESLAKLSEKYFGGVARETVSKYLSGDLEPTVSMVAAIAKDAGCDREWLAWGGDVPYPFSPHTRLFRETIARLAKYSKELKEARRREKQ